MLRIKVYVVLIENEAVNKKSSCTKNMGSQPMRSFSQTNKGYKGQLYPIVTPILTNLKHRVQRKYPGTTMKNQISEGGKHSTISRERGKNLRWLFEVINTPGVDPAITQP